MTVTLTAVEASFQKAQDGWGLLRLRSVDPLATFKREKRQGNMRVEDFFEAWHLNGNAVKGKLIFAGPKKPITVMAHLRQAEYSPLMDELTIMIQPLDSKVKIPQELEAVELAFLIEPIDQPFWDKWMGL